MDKQKGNKEVKENKVGKENKKKKENNPTKDYADMIFERERQFCHQVISEMHAKIAVLSYLKKQTDDKKRLGHTPDDLKKLNKVFRNASEQIIDIKKRAWPHLEEQILDQFEERLKEIPEASEELKIFQKNRKGVAPTTTLQ